MAKAVANHSLWPQHARPRRDLSPAVAVGGFCVGILAALSAHNVLTELLPAATVQQAAPQSAPLQATAPAPDMAVASASPARPARSGASVATAPAAVAAPASPPTSAAPAAPQMAAAIKENSAATTDGRGGADTIEARFAGLTPAPTSAAPVNAAEPVKAAAEEPVATASEPPKAEPVAAVPAPPVKRPVQKPRQKPADYASRQRDAPLFPFFGLGSLFGQRRG